VHTNHAENFWSLLKRGINGTYVSVEPYHLFRYVDEQAFSLQQPKDIDDYGRFKMVLTQLAGKRLTYESFDRKREGGRDGNLLRGRDAGNANSPLRC